MKARRHKDLVLQTTIYPPPKKKKLQTYKKERQKAFRIDDLLELKKKVPKTFTEPDGPSEKTIPVPLSSVFLLLVFHFAKDTPVSDVTWPH